MKRIDKELLLNRIVDTIVEIPYSILFFLGSMILTIVIAAALFWAYLELWSMFRLESNILRERSYDDRKSYEMLIDDYLAITLTEKTYYYGGFTSIRDYHFPLYATLGKATTSYTEDEFLQLSESLLEKLTHESPAYWKIKDVKYHIYDCEKGFDGYVHATYSYEYSQLAGQYYSIEGHKLELLPSSEYASDFPYSYAMREVEEDYYPVLDEPSLITATQAYEIIEDNGGYQARSQEDNRYCETIILIDEDNPEKWHIWYTGKHGVMFEGLVDRQSGKFKKIRVKN